MLLIFLLLKANGFVLLVFPPATLGFNAFLLPLNGFLSSAFLRVQEMFADICVMRFANKSCRESKGGSGVDACTPGSGGYNP